MPVSQISDRKSDTETDFSMENGRKLKRGEILFKEGDPIKSLFLIQSGKIGLMSGKAGKPIEVASLGANQAIGEHALLGSNARHEFTGEALVECKILEVPLEVMKLQYDKTAPLIKLLVKSASDEARQARKQFKMQKLETEKVPLPQGHIHRLFGEVQLIARHIGTKSANDPQEIIVAWDALRLYATRFFGESPQRLRSLMDLLLKLKFCDFTVTRTEEGEEVLTNLKIRSIQVLEDFAEFFQFNLYKGSRAEAIFVDPLALRAAKAFVEISTGITPDFRGATHLDWTHLMNECKSRFRMDLKNTHLDALERKGLFVKRLSQDDGRVDISFDRNEFEKMALYWSILLEIDKWNEKGFVDLNEKESDLAAGEAAGESCPSCGGAVDGQHKFCPHCGFKLVTTPAA